MSFGKLARIVSWSLRGVDGDLAPVVALGRPHVGDVLVGAVGVVLKLALDRLERDAVADGFDEDKVGGDVRLRDHRVLGGGVEVILKGLVLGLVAQDDGGVEVLALDDAQEALGVTVEGGVELALPLLVVVAGGVHVERVGDHVVLVVGHCQCCH